MRSGGNATERTEGAGGVSVAGIAMPSVRSSYQAAQPRQTRDGTRVASFVLVRLTGLMLTVLVLGHFTLTHIVHDVADTDAAFVARRWGSALWVIWDWLMLATAIAHGATGVAIAIDDYSPDPASRRRRRRVLLGLSAIALAGGTLTIVAAAS
jgi:succinate dehydrogenase / fumarate reductase membrane anchor subunit